MLTMFSNSVADILYDNEEAIYRCGRNNSHISKGNYKQMVRGITKNVLFPKYDITKFFYFRFSKLYHPNGGRDGRYTFGAVLLEWPPLVGLRTEDDV
jgi:hypothetical protein